VAGQAARRARFGLVCSAETLKKQQQSQVYWDEIPKGLPLAGFSALSIYDLSIEAHKEHLLALLSGGTQVVESTAGASQRLRRIILDGEAGTVIREENYYDEDHMRCHQRRYSRSIWQPKALCLRLHFFGGSLPPTRFARRWRSHAERGAADGGTKASKKLKYLGFLVLRDIPDEPIGRTVLSNALVGEAYRKHYQKQHKDASVEPDFTACQQAEANIGGVRLVCQATPQMPAGETGVCASAACWVALRSLQGRQLARWLSLTEITEIANRQITLGHIMPSEGLTPLQMCNILREAGVDPFFREVGLYPSQHPDSLMHFIIELFRTELYSLIEGGMPVILLTRCNGEGHAVAVIGHTFRKKDIIDPLSIPEGRGKSLVFRSAANTVIDFITHDSLLGPFELGRIEHGRWRGSRCVVLKPTAPFGSAVDRDIGAYVVTGYVALSPLEVCISAWQALLKTVGFVDLISRKKPKAVPTPGDLVFRTLLKSGTDFKRYISAAGTGAPARLVGRYLGMSLPKWIYVTHLRHYRDTKAPAVEGEVLLDATTKSLFRSILSVHYKSFFLEGPKDPKVYSSQELDTAVGALGPECDTYYEPIHAVR